MDEELKRLLEESKRQVEAMTPAQLKEMLRVQAAGWAKTEASWPKARYHWENGVKVYESYEDYCND